MASQDALPREITLLRVTEAQLNTLLGRGFALLSRTDNTIFGGLLVRLEVPTDLSTAQGLALARQLAPGALADLNHIYRPGQAAEQRTTCTTAGCRQRALIGWPSAPQTCELVARIGVIDTAVDGTNPALAGQSIEIIDGVSSGRARSSVAHGTGVVGLLAGRSDGVVPGLLPRASVVAVEAFHKTSAGEDIADTYDMIRAIDALLTRGLTIINMSFTGPANDLLAEAVRQAAAREVVLVASAGNFGPSSPPVYPAGYASVLATTAVGNDLQLYRQANRGSYVDIAAPGVEVEVVGPGGRKRFETGTSFATPHVTAAVAASVARAPGTSLDAVVQSLTGTATDLGRPGRDASFGWGLLQTRGICP